MRDKKSTTLKITRVTGTNDSGKDVLGYVNFSMVNPELADDDLLSIEEKLANLQAFPVDSIGRMDSCHLVQEH